MSSENTESNDSDLIPLLDHLKQEIPIEDIRDYSSPQRLGSIDFVKGFAIIFIILCHASSVWFDKDWLFIYGEVYAVLDILGPSLFIFLSALSVIFSIQRKKGKLPDEVIRNRIFSRGITIMAIGILYNVIAFETLGGGRYPFPANLWGWNILMFIGFSQIFSFYAIKISRSTRIIVGFAIITYSESIRQAAFLAKDTNIISWIAHYLITSPVPQVTLFPWIAVILISTIFGELLYEAMMEGPGPAYQKLYRTFSRWGILLILFGIFFPFPNPGWALQSHDFVSFPGMTISEYPQFMLFDIINKQNYVIFPGMPLFLIRGTASSMWYNLGWALLIIAISFKVIDINGKYNHFISMVQYYGKTSLSLFLIHYIFLPFYLGAFNIIFFPFIVITFLGFMGFFMYYWMESGGVGSPEWIMIQIGRIGQKTGEKTKAGIKKLEAGIKKKVKN
jgi:uncharacterized membrane protein